jgi:CO/xanthine dehydrogenase Mo-binding subunit
MSTSIGISRREFLEVGGALIVSFAVPLQRILADEPAAGAAAKAAKTVAADQVDGFLAIDAQGKITVFSGKVDLGTGVRTALTQIAAEELSVPFAQVDVIQGDTALTPDQGVSYGSLSIQNGGMQIRQAAATARRALLAQAAKSLGVAEGDLVIDAGMIKHRDGSKSISYGELIGGKNFMLALDKDAPLKDPASYTIVGRSQARLDIPDKVTGKFTYMQDFRVDGMLHGRVVRPPAIGANLQDVDEASVANVPGLVKVVRQGDFLGVVATSEWGAISAAKQLKATWSDWAGLPDETKLWEHVRATKVSKDDVTSNVGDADAALGKATKKLSATYDFAIHTHGSIGPSCAIAQFDGGKLTCWSASQATHNLRKQLASMLGLADADVRAIYIDGSGCYGRNGHEDAAADAALLARAVGRPVRVQWMRADEHGWDPKGPPTLIDLQAGLAQDGSIDAWSSQFYVPEGAAGLVKLVAAEHAGLPFDAKMSPGGIINDSAVAYTFPNVKTVAHRLESTPFRPSWIRAPGRMQNTFANEAFLDEIAAQTGADPIELRLRYIKNDARGTELLERLRTFAKWKKHASSKDRHATKTASGRGVAYVKYELTRTYVGMVATVDVDPRTGIIKAKHFAVVQDCGQVINPDGMKNQIEGNVVQTVSRTLIEQLTFDRSRVTSLDWKSYPILTFPDVPEVDIELIDRPKEKPWGVGEPSSALVSAVISNAVFDAIGVRLRSVPFVPAKVVAAIKAA